MMMQITHQIVTALKTALSYGCPACHGDCGSANPPVSGCPMQEYQAALTAALAATQPVADAEVERVCVALLAGIKDDTYDGLVGTSAGLIREAATLIRALHARAVRAEAERDHAKDGWNTAIIELAKATIYFRDKLDELPQSVWRDMHLSVTAQEAIDAQDKWISQIESERDKARALLAEAKEALRDVRAALVEAPADVLSDTLWIPSDRSLNETCLDGIDAMLARLGAAMGNPITEQDQGDR